MLQNKRIFYIFIKDKKLIESIYAEIKDKRDIYLLKVINTFLDIVNNELKGNKINSSNERKSITQDDLIGIYRVPSDSKFTAWEFESDNLIDLTNTVNDCFDGIFNVNLFTKGQERTVQLDYMKCIIALIESTSKYLKDEEIIQECNKRLTNSIIESNSLKRMTEFFFSAQWNSYYQFSYQRLIQTISKTCSADSINLLKALGFIEEAKDKLFTEWTRSRLGGYLQPGFLSVLIDLCGLISSSSNKEVKEYLDKDYSWTYLTFTMFNPLLESFKRGLLFSDTQSLFRRTSSGREKDDSEPMIPIREFIKRCSIRYSRFNKRKINSKVNYCLIMHRKMSCHISKMRILRTFLKVIIV